MAQKSMIDFFSQKGRLYKTCRAPNDLDHSSESNEVQRSSSHRELKSVGKPTNPAVPSGSEQHLSRESQESREPEKKYRRIDKPLDNLKYTHTGPNNDYLATHSAIHEQFRKALGGKRRVAKPRVIKPYEQQYIDLKLQWMDSIVVVQNGYKYHIYGNDAYNASKALGRHPIAGWKELEEGINPSDALYERFASITFPLEVLPSYLEKLVANGHKVAVANQVETAGLKAIGDNKKGPFRREVKHVYTKGTMVEELTTSSKLSGHIMVIFQVSPLRFAIMAAQPATGHCVCDEFEDSDLVMELETRLLHIEPSEIVYVGSVSVAVEKLVQSYASKFQARIVPREHPSTEEVQSAFERFPQSNTQLTDSDGLRLAFAALLLYVKEFSLEKLFALPENVVSFSLKSHMYLSGDTINSLEIFQNQTNFQTHGSLLWVLDRTSTAFGRRMLRTWIAKPLLDRQLLFDRVEAVENIMNCTTDIFASLRAVMSRAPDLERYTLQIYHGRITPRQLYWALFHLQKISTAITRPKLAAATDIKSPLLSEILHTISSISEHIESLLKRININKARDGCGPREFFVDDSFGADPQLQLLSDLEDEIDNLKQAFTQHTRTEARSLGIPLKEARVLGEEFVIATTKKDARSVPSDWVRVNTTTQEIRWRSPVCASLKKQYQPLIEKTEAAAQQAFEEFVRGISQNHFEALRKVVATLAKLDCLQSLAEVSTSKNYVRPDIVDSRCLEITDGRHPMIEQLIDHSFIANSVSMYENLSRTMIITGPNMGGKSSFVRQVALIIIMAQIGCYVPARKVRLSVVDGIYTRMGAFDNMLRGESTFMVELKECSTILRRASERSLVLLDEIGRGTSTLDGVAIAYSVLYAMIQDVKSFTLFITHYPLLAELADHFPKKVTNWSMSSVQEGEDVTFLYSLINKVAERSYGVNVARLAEMPESILIEATRKSRELEQKLDITKSLLLLRDALRGNQHSVTELIDDNYDTEVEGFGTIASSQES